MANRVADLSRLRLACWAPVKIVNHIGSRYMCPQALAGKSLPTIKKVDGKDQLELLQGITSAFRPGILTCLMVSWAGLQRFSPSQWGISTPTYSLLSAGRLWCWQYNPHGRAGWPQDR